MARPTPQTHGEILAAAVGPWTKGRRRPWRGSVSSTPSVGPLDFGFRRRTAVRFTEDEAVVELPGSLMMNG